MIRTFFKEVHDTSKLMKIVKKYRYAVIKAQSLVRSFVAVQNARMLALLKYSDKFEHALKMNSRKQSKSIDTFKKPKSIEDLEERRKKKSIFVKKDKKENPIGGLHISE